MIPSRRKPAIGQRFGWTLAYSVLLLAAACQPEPEQRIPQAAALTPALEATPEGAAAIAVAEATLLAISESDSSALRELLDPAARLAAVGEDPSTPPRLSDLEQFLVSVSSPEADFLERMWDPSVAVDGRIATVWTPYDFYRGGEFSHCGIDVFDMVHDGSRWRVLSITYTVQTQGCPASPLGPPS